MHCGTQGYNLDDDGGKIGDQFMRNIEQIAAYVPYMAGIGNHEDGRVALAHYTERYVVLCFFVFLFLPIVL